MPVNLPNVISTGITDMFLNLSIVMIILACSLQCSHNCSRSFFDPATIAALTALTARIDVPAHYVELYTMFR